MLVSTHLRKAIKTQLISSPVYSISLCGISIFHVMWSGVLWRRVVKRNTGIIRSRNVNWAKMLIISAPLHFFWLYCTREVINLIRKSKQLDCTAPTMDFHWSFPLDFFGVLAQFSAPDRDSDSDSGLFNVSLFGSSLAQWRAQGTGNSDCKCDCSRFKLIFVRIV
jgi:hypothetical protein